MISVLFPFYDGIIFILGDDTEPTGKECGYIPCFCGGDPLFAMPSAVSLNAYYHRFFINKCKIIEKFKSLQFFYTLKFHET